MTLSFSTQLNGKPTFFVEQIINCLKSEGHHIDVLGVDVKMGMQLKDRFGVECGSKKHTIRADQQNRWKAGKDIHFVVFNRTPRRFQFAPLVPCKSTQKIEINHRGGQAWFEVLIDGKLFAQHHGGFDAPFNLEGLELLAKNDGFENVHDFIDYFSDDFTGKIIHWTDFTYSF